MLQPFIPFSAERLHELLGLSGKAGDAGWSVRPPKPGGALPTPEPLFTKLEDSVADEQVGRLG